MCELKPCPFCGKSPTIFYSSGKHDSYSEGPDLWQIACDNCDLAMDGETEESDKIILIEKWNRRDKK